MARRPQVAPDDRDVDGCTAAACSRASRVTCGPPPALVDLPGTEGGGHDPSRLASDLARRRPDLAMERSRVVSALQKLDSRWSTSATESRHMAARINSDDRAIGRWRRNTCWSAGSGRTHVADSRASSGPLAAGRASRGAGPGRRTRPDPRIPWREPAAHLREGEQARIATMAEVAQPGPSGSWHQRRARDRGAARLPPGRPEGARGGGRPRRG